MKTFSIESEVGNHIVRVFRNGVPLGAFPFSTRLAAEAFAESL